MLLKVQNLNISFYVNDILLPAVSDVSFSINKGEIVALIGESGCGKSVTCMSLTRLLPDNAKYEDGIVTFYDDDKEIDILSLNNKQIRKIRGRKIAYIFQEASTSLNPVFTIGNQIAETIILHQKDILNIEQEVINLLTLVGIPEPKIRINCYPHEMSGGMQQRIMIAIALATKPDLLIADEPTTALDVTVQAQILDLLCEIRKKHNMAIILVTHNLGIVAQIADRGIVMYAGHTVEEGNVNTILKNSKHPYTKALLSAIPTLKANKTRLTTISGQVPSPEQFPSGCRFYERCDKYKVLSEDEQKHCREIVPSWEERENKHFVRCYH